MPRYSILDLVPITQGSDARCALERSKQLAIQAESWGYHRYWVAEHHNMPGIASSATVVVMGHLAAATQTIRVGSGGIMLPNHAPLLVAEQFGTLATLYPNRIDLGIGRAPGTDGLTMQALRRNLGASVEDFPNDVLELQHYLKPVEPGQRVSATPGAGTNVPIWILGSSLYGAQLAASLGMPFAFASHFAPTHLSAAIDLYRKQFQPSESLAAPYVMLGFNLCVAETDEQAHYLRSSSLQSFVNLRRGMPAPLPGPVEAFEASLSPAERKMIEVIGQCSAVGSLQTVQAKLDRFLSLTGADELMLVSSIFDPEQRLKSYELGAVAMQNLSQAAQPHRAAG
ncbi:LLM class flavin-dependent oxidoreductase [Luminiphilus sp.]|nr:LLM class flavin-dependent oxidoreductase [Luminiphilus sp.]